MSMCSFSLPTLIFRRHLLQQQRRVLSHKSKNNNNDNNNTKFRIVSLCPSTTLTLYDLGLSDSVVGRTQFCEDDVTDETRTIPTYGGTKNPRWKKIAQVAKPTHILFNMEENNYKHLPDAQAICGMENTITDTPTTIAESREMVSHLGRVFGVEERAQEICNDMDAALDKLQEWRLRKNGEKEGSSFSYLYFVWHTPGQRVVGKGTYIGAMLAEAGGVNLAVKTIVEQEGCDSERYPLLPKNYDEQADFCLLSTEPFAFDESHIPMYAKYGKSTRIIDGEMLSWHGSRTVAGLEYLSTFFQKK